MLNRLSTCPLAARFALAAIVAVFIALVGVTTGEGARVCAGRDTSELDVPVSRGIDLEVRLFHVRIEFPWMKALPVSPGHHIVISVLAPEQEPSL